MYLELFRKWIRRIYATQEEELDCDGFFEAIPKVVDMEVAGEKTNNPRFAEVEHHFKQCSQCYDLYLALRDAALLESRQVARQVVPEPRAVYTPTERIARSAATPSWTDPADD